MPGYVPKDPWLAGPILLAAFALFLVVAYVAQTRRRD